MKWKEDLTKDIRYHDQRDDIDNPHFLDMGYPHAIEFSKCNQSKLRESFLKKKDTCKCILEIGVHRNKTISSTSTLLELKNKETFYVGVDILDKSYLNDKDNNIYTIATSSSNYEEIVNLLSSLNIDKIDYLFIDGWHSINQVYQDWEFTKILSKDGVVGFHDTTRHPGPEKFIKNLNTTKWETEILCPEDNGIGFAWLK
jgi:hypothetical protein